MNILKRKNMSDDFPDMNVEELQSYFSDFHKDYYGFRPRFATPEPVEGVNPPTVPELQAQINLLSE